MKRLVIFGCGRLGELAHFHFVRDAGRTVAGFTVDAPYLQSSRFCGQPVVPFDRVQAEFPPDNHELFIAIGYSEATPAAGGGGCRIGPGCFVGNGCNIRDNLTIEERSFLGAGSLVLRDLPAGAVVRAVETRRSAVPSHRLGL